MYSAFNPFSVVLRGSRPSSVLESDLADYPTAGRRGDHPIALHPDRPGLTACDSGQATACMVLGLVASFRIILSTSCGMLRSR